METNIMTLLDWNELVGVESHPVGEFGDDDPLTSLAPIGADVTAWAGGGFAVDFNIVKMSHDELYELKDGSVVASWDAYVPHAPCACSKCSC